MSERVKIHDPDELDRLAGRLSEYQREVERALTCGLREIERTLGYLGERHTHWRQQLDGWTEEARRREGALRRCLAVPTDRDEPPPNCDYLLEALREAQARINHARDCLEAVSTLVDDVQQAAGEFQRGRGRLESNLRQLIPRASADLQKKAARARELAAHQFSGSPFASSGVIFPAPPGGGDSGAVGPGPHGGSPGEGSAREGSPNREGSDGPVRVPAGSGEREGGETGTERF